MSYSICLNCRGMVSSYQKYCKKCEKNYKQNETFWKDGETRTTVLQVDMVREAELNRDRK